MIKRPAIAAAVIAASALLATTTTAHAALPAGTTAVPVTAGASTGGVDVTLPVAGSVSGRLTTTGGKPVDNAQIQLYDAAGKKVYEGDYDGEPYVQGANADGSYTVPALNAGTYYACARSDKYVDTCYGGVTQSTGHGDPLPKGAKPITVKASQHVTGIDITMAPGVAFSGSISAARSAKVHPYVDDLTVLNRSTGDLEHVEYNFTSRYSVFGLRPSAKGYTVCFAVSGDDSFDVDTGEGFRYGYLDQCWNRKAWTSPGKKPAGAVLTVAPGTVRRDVNAVLQTAGAVSGTVLVNGRTPVNSQPVQAFSRSGQVISTTSTNQGGTYLLRGLPATKIARICVPKTSDLAAGQCWKGVKYTSGAPSKGAGNVSVALGRTHTGINLSLTAATSAAAASKPARGTITGAVITPQRDPATGLRVLAYDTTTSKVAARGVVGGKGDYVLNVPAGTYRVCAAQAYDDSVNAGTAPGYAPGCRGASWDGGGSAPTAATPVKVGAGATRSIVFSVPAAGAIAGTVTITNGYRGTDVFVYNAKGQRVASGYPYTDAGRYRIVGLAPSTTGYTVCFTGSEPDIESDANSVGSLPYCYEDKVWNIPVPQAEYGTD